MMRFILSRTPKWLVLIFVLGSQFAWSQMTVKGKVVSMIDDGVMPGVNVIIKGTTNGTATDASGAYSIEVPDSNTILVFSFIGFQSEEIQVGQQSVIDVSMSPSLEELMEVLVVGYSEKKKQEITGAVSNVSAEEIKGITGSNIEYMLQGKVAGVQVITGTGAPGAAAEILIRGTSSISARQGPLIVVDGMIGGNYNPNDVESVTVMKDAGATALYGSRANGGVIVITTRRGKSEKPQITYSTTMGVREMTTGKFKLMDSQSLYTTERLMFNSSAQFNSLRPSTVVDTNTDWLNLAYHDGFVQNHNIAATGKSGKVSYYVAGDYYDEEGTLLSTAYERFNFRSNLDFQFSDAVKLTTNLAITKDRTNSYHWRWPYQPFLYLPYDSPYDADGEYAYIDATTPGFLTRDKNNILHSALYNDYETDGVNLVGDFLLSVNINPWLSLQSRNRIGYSGYRSDSYEDTKTIEGASYGGILSFNTSFGFSGISTNMIRVSHDFGSHGITGFVGVEAAQNVIETAGGNGYGIVSGIRVPGIVASPQGFTGSKGEERAFSYLSEINYNFKEKYFLTASYRRDGSSLFGENKRYGNFGALSASWLVSSEDFFAGMKDIANTLKLRGSYGIMGNDRIPQFQYAAKYSFESQYNGNPAGYPEILPNPDLSWERTKTANIGLEISLLNRIDLTVDAFNKKTDQLLLAVAVPPSQGISFVYKNAGQVDNKGIEIGLGGNVISRRNLSWSLNMNLGTASNNVKSLPKLSESIGRYYDGLKQMIQVGHDVNSWYLPKWAGVNPDTGAPQWEKAVLDTEGNVVSYEVTDSYAEASALANLQFVGSATPKFFGGISTAVTYKRFSLSVSSAYQYGNKIYHRTREFIDADGANFNFNMMELQEGWSRWMSPGDVATHPQPIYGGNNQSNKPSSRYLEDGSYLRIRNIRLTYDISPSLLSKVRISRASIFVSADNLFTFTKFSGMDPEVPTSPIMGLSDFKYPISKQFLAGAQISF